MVNIVNGNALNFKEDLLIHQVNYNGIMGAGIAKQIKNKWNNVYKYYKKLCDNKKDNLLGCIEVIDIDDNKQIVNMFSQSNNTEKRQTSYLALMKCLLKIFNYATDNDKTIAIPYGMCCGLAGGNWDYVYNLICMLSEEYNINVTIYKLI